MDALLLSRIQFGISIGFHYLFPVTTLGLTFFIVIFESLHFFRKSDMFGRISAFFVSFLGLIFAIGVASGLMMPFAIGANWSRFSSFAGAVFGPALAIEAMTAFAFETAFIAILILGRRRVSPFVYWLSAVFVFAGSHVSGFLIVAANSWLQTPAGFEMLNGRIASQNLLSAFLNPSTVIRFFHVVTGAWLTGALLITGIATYYLARNRNVLFSQSVAKISMVTGLCLALLQPVIGHSHILNVLENNPEKDAAYEGIFYPVDGAPLYSFGIPDAKNNRILFAIGIPYALSFLESGNPFSHVRGLTEYPKENWPPVDIIFTTFHLMVMLGVIMIAAFGLGIFLLWRKKLFDSKWLLFLFPWLIPVPYLANELGWIGAEIGRQPWMIYKVLRTADASSITIPAWQIGASLTFICIMYALIGSLTLIFALRKVRQGPKEIEGAPHA